MGNQYSKDKLVQLLESKFKTAGIGAVASIENHFGRLWGHGEQEEDISPQQLQNREVWQQLRTEILDKVHDQKRQIFYELDQYDITWNRYQIQFISKNSQNS